MHAKRLIALVLTTLALGLGSVPPSARAISSASGIDARLRLEWEPGQGRGGRPVITGYIYNDYGRPAGYVHLLVETLDDKGQVIDQTIGFVQGTVPFAGRAYFVIPLSKAGAAYRIRVTSFDWLGGGGA